MNRYLLCSLKHDDNYYLPRKPWWRRREWLCWQRGDGDARGVDDDSSDDCRWDDDNDDDGDAGVDDDDTFEEHKMHGCSGENIFPLIWDVRN